MYYKSGDKSKTRANCAYSRRERSLFGHFFNFIFISLFLSPSLWEIETEILSQTLKKSTNQLLQSISCIHKCCVSGSFTYKPLVNSQILEHIKLYIDVFVKNLSFYFYFFFLNLDIDRRA